MSSSAAKNARKSRRILQRLRELNNEQLKDVLAKLYRSSMLLVLLHEFDNHIESAQSFRELTPQRKRFNKLYMEQCKKK